MFLLASDLAQEVTETVSSNFQFWSWDMVVDYFKNSLPGVLDFLIKLIIAIIVLLIGRKIIKVVRKIVKRMM